MNKGSIVERLCSDLDRKEPRYKCLLYFTLLLYTPRVTLVTFPRLSFGTTTVVVVVVIIVVVVVVESRSVMHVSPYIVYYRCNTGVS